MLVITCLGGGFGINCPREFLTILKLPEQNEGNFKIFKNHEGDLPKKLTKPRMQLLVNHTRAITNQREAITKQWKITK